MTYALLKTYTPETREDCCHTGTANDHPLREENMENLTREFIRDRIADSPVIYKRGVSLYEHGSFLLRSADHDKGMFTYDVDGNYGDYVTTLQLDGNGIETSCNCPYPGKGCKHIVAVMLDAADVIRHWKEPAKTVLGYREEPLDDFLTPDEIKQLAIDDRRARSRTETFSVTEGEMIKGAHLVETKRGRQYTVTLHSPEEERGHCTCPDFLTNRLGTCKHIIFLSDYFRKKPDFRKKLARERFPYVDIFWDSILNRPKLFTERPKEELRDIAPVMSQYFDEEGHYIRDELSDLINLLSSLDHNKKVRVQETVLERLDRSLKQEQIVQLARKSDLPALKLKTRLYPYQKAGVEFCLFKDAVLIGDEMGLGKTLQAIALAILKKEIFGFAKVLVVTLASLKEQWKREIEHFTDEEAVVVAGPPKKRHNIYRENPAYFKITNYEAVLRDVTMLARYKPDIMILDEAQRIKNFSTKTADAVKHIPRNHAMVLTGTPLENKLEDVYSIVQFLDPYLLAPLWQFAADHFMLSRKKNGKILGYKNLDLLREKLKPIVIRRKKEDVLPDLPEEVENNYYIDLHEKQKKIHSGYLQALIPLINKKFLTPMDLRRIQEILLRMRMVCDSTYLIDRKTHISPKLLELQGIIDELVIQNEHKVVIFSEWTTMTFLIARHLSEAEISFVELSGKVPVKKRQALIDEFTHNEECKVFLSTDAGGTGLNLQAADCVVNFELPWNPAKLNQRVGRVSRIGQKSRCINVVNLISKNSIEEKILAGIQLKTDLFKGVFEGGADEVEFSHEKRTQMLNRLREMMGEEPALTPRESTPSEEIPEDTPYYLNPEVLREKEKEEAMDFVAEEETGDAGEPGQEGQEDAGHGSILAEQPPEKLEAVLNSGMQFIGGLLEVATGKKLTTSDDSQQMLKIDKETGEVTLKFKLPGF